MFAINGKQDESTPPWVCKNFGLFNNPKLYLLITLVDIILKVECIHLQDMIPKAHTRFQLVH